MPIVIETATATAPRYGFTVDEVRRMCDAGVLSWDDRSKQIVDFGAGETLSPLLIDGLTIRTKDAL